MSNCKSYGKTVLVTAIGGPTGYGVIKCLRDVPGVRLVGVDASMSCPHKDLVNAFELVPRSADARYADAIDNIVSTHNVDVLVPTLQEELSLPFKSLSHIKMLTSGRNVLPRVLNKLKLYDFLARHSMEYLVPRHNKLAHVELLNSAVSEIGYPNLPVCVKPIDGHGGLGFRIIAGDGQVAERYFSEQINSWSTLSEMRRVLTHQPDPMNLILVEYLPGDEYSVDALIDRGDLLLAVPRKRSRVSNGIVVNGITQDCPALVDISREVASVLGLNYFANLQFKYSADGLPKLIDVNPRFCGSQIASWGAGVNFPELCLKLAFGEQFDVPAPEWGVEMTRYWECSFSGSIGESQ